MEQPPEMLVQQYRRRFSRHEDYRNNVWRILCSDFLSRYVAKDSMILDLGSGWGEFINNIEATGKHAMDLNEDGMRRVSADVNFIRQDCATTWPFAAGSLDVVFTSNFLEHLPDKASLERTVMEAHRCLKDNGLLICLGPNIRCVPGAYWDFWDHRIPLTEKSCSELLQLIGFDIAECHARFLPYSMSGGARSPLFLVALYLRLPLVWPLFGRQFFVVGRKPSRGGRNGIQ
jgi:SAM-dependent methyltransferase